MPGESMTKLGMVVATLQRHGVEFLIVGGMAEALFGSDRPTYDVDICYRRRPENFTRLATALKEIQARLRGVPPDLPFQLDARTLEAGNNFTFPTQLGDLDALGYLEPTGASRRLLGKPRRTAWAL